MDVSTMGTTVLAITIIAYLFGEAVKALPIVKNEFIPVIVGFIGGILGIVGMYIIPDFPAQDWLNAMAVGIASGLASTGANQVLKQLFTKSE